MWWFLAHAVAATPFHDLVVERTYWHSPAVSEPMEWVLLQGRRSEGLSRPGRWCLVGLAADRDIEPVVWCRSAPGTSAPTSVAPALKRRAKRAVRAQRSGAALPALFPRRLRAIRQAGGGRLVEVTEAVVMESASRPVHARTTLRWLVDDDGTWTLQRPFRTERGPVCREDCAETLFVDRVLPDATDGSLPLLALAHGQLPSAWEPFVADLKHAIVNERPVDPASVVARQGPTVSDDVSCMLSVQVGGDGALGALTFFYPQDAPVGWSAVKEWSMGGYYASVLVELTVGDGTFELEGFSNGHVRRLSVPMGPGSPCPTVAEIPRKALPASWSGSPPGVAGRRTAPGPELWLMGRDSPSLRSMNRRLERIQLLLGPAPPAPSQPSP